jgi:FlaA1/EpsC-like NDP-sugar epimerase
MPSLNPRTVSAFIHDLFAIGLAWVLAFLLRFNFELPYEYVGILYSTVGWVVLIGALIFLSFRLYKGIWRYASIHDLKLLLTAVGVSALAVPTAILLLQPIPAVPRSVFVLHPLLLAAIMSASRLAYRAWNDRRIGNLGALNGKPVVIVGAGDAAVSLLKALARSSEWCVIGLLDDDPTKWGRQILGATVLGATETFPGVAARYGIEHAIIAMPSMSHQVRKRLVSLCQSAGTKVLTVPSFDDLMDGKVAVSEIRQIELDDLLGRDPVLLDTVGLHRLLDDRAVLVTGAGGSIGAELCRQIAKFSPRIVILFELSEYALYGIEQEFREQFPRVQIVSLIGDVKNQKRIDEVFSRYKPNVVFHAAAYKHVPLLEMENAWEAIDNNVMGTRTVGEAALRHGVEKFVLISTDKAVNPTNVMGASKRLAEMVCQGLQSRGETRFVLVRFGNVLGSTGSVIPKFHQQVAQGGPITVTHPEITRYFMSIPEAAQLVLQSGLMGERGEIFVLDMGEPVRIVDLARDVIRLSGLTEKDIKIVFTGLRPGEKLYEELLADGEAYIRTPHPKLRIARSRSVEPEFFEQLDVILARGATMSGQELRELLRRWVPEYCAELESAASIEVN